MKPRESKRKASHKRSPFNAILGQCWIRSAGNWQKECVWTILRYTRKMLCRHPELVMYVWLIYCWLNTIEWARGLITGLGDSWQQWHCRWPGRSLWSEGSYWRVRGDPLLANCFKRFLCVLCKYIDLCKWAYVWFKHQLALELFKTPF